MSRSPGPGRSLLFVPGADERKLERARGTDADVVLFDLEDSVTPERKAAARALVAAALRDPDAGGAERAVRVNPPSTPYFEEDLEILIEAGASMLMLPKVESAAGVAEVERRIETLETRSGRADAAGVRLLALIETPAGLIDAAAIAGGSERIDALCFGNADFALEMGLPDADAGHGVLLHARMQLAIAARARGRTPIDGIYQTIRDDEAFRVDAALGRDLGYEGKLCIHPDQVPLANQVYTPDPEQIERARGIVEGWSHALEEGRGAFTFDGKMVDAPLVELQERILERARRAGVA